ncbi:MAG TPA: hypothetical protein VMF30_16100 [Pirellulales bacterium]|nr:hypothetical protein [Pirellulales bacterium]
MRDKERLKSLRIALWDALAPRMKQHGLRGRRAHGDWHFEKRVPIGFATFDIYLILHSDDFDVTANVFVRFDAIEELAYRRIDFLTASEKTRGVTLGAEIGNLTVGRQLRWTVADESDIDPVARALEEQLVDVALPYVETHCDLETAYKLLSSDADEAATECVGPYYFCAMEALAAALLLKKSSAELQELHRRKRAFLFQTDDIGLARFDEFVQSLADDGLLPGASRARKS